MVIVNPMCPDALTKNFIWGRPSDWGPWLIPLLPNNRPLLSHTKHETRPMTNHCLLVFAISINQESGSASSPHTIKISSSKLLKHFSAPTSSVYSTTLSAFEFLKQSRSTERFLRLLFFVNFLYNFEVILWEYWTAPFFILTVQTVAWTAQYWLDCTLK